VSDPTWRQRLAVLLLLVALLAGFAVLRSFWRRQLSHLTGTAQWVWVTDALERVHPIAGLFVGRVELDAPPAIACSRCAATASTSSTSTVRRRRAAGAGPASGSSSTTSPTCCGRGRTSSRSKSARRPRSAGCCSPSTSIGPAATSW